MDCSIAAQLTTRREQEEDVTTKHTCNHGNGPVFGRKTPGCPRCDQLLAGFPAVKWAKSREQIDRERSQEIRDHFRSHKHLSGGCGPVCTFGEW